MKNLKSRLFIEALKNFEINPKTVSKYLSNSSITSDQKKILECWKFFEQEEFPRLLGLLDTIHSNDSVVQAQKYLLLGIALNYEEQFRLAVPLIIQAYEVMKEFHIPQYQFMIINHLFTSYSKIGDDDGVEYCLDEMKDLGRHLVSSFIKKAA